MKKIKVPSKNKIAKVEPKITEIKMLITICNRGKSALLLKRLENVDSTMEIVLLGRGTANSDILDYLGLGESEKDVVISILKADMCQIVLKELEPILQKHGKGIAFTIPISSMIGMMAYNFLTKNISKGDKNGKSK